LSREVRRSNNHDRSRHDTRKYGVRLIGRDAKGRPALLRGRGMANGEAIFSFVRIARELRGRRWVIAVGNPFGLGGHRKRWDTSFGQRATRNQMGPSMILQIDAPVNQGQFGGPHPPSSRDVLASIHSAIFFPRQEVPSVGFALPRRTGQPARCRQLKERGAVRVAGMGVTNPSRSTRHRGGLASRNTSGALVDRASVEQPCRPVAGVMWRRHHRDKRRGGQGR